MKKVLGIGAFRKGALLKPANIDFAIAGLATEKTNYTIPIYVHRGKQVSESLSSDVFLDGKCKTDFSDVYFEDGNGNKLDHYIASIGNHEYRLSDNNLGYINLICKNGDILSTSVPNLGTLNYSYLSKSTDNGVTWTMLYYATGSIICLYEDSHGYLYIGVGFKVYRSIDLGVTFSQVLDFTAVSGKLILSNITENVNGDIYIGRYQAANNNVAIFKSTDGGATFNSIYAEAVHQHCHAVKCDPVTGYVYAGLDGTTFAVVRSVDNGANWTTLNAPASGANPDAIYCGNGYRLFGSEDQSQANTMYRTTDDITFTTVLKTGHLITCINKINGILFAVGQSLQRNCYPALFTSTDEGLTWKTIRVFDFTKTAFSGYDVNNVTMGIPKGETLQQLILGRFTTTDLKTARLIGSGNNYEALCYVKIPTLTTSGITIKVKSAGLKPSTTDAFVDPAISNLILWYKLNEGSGTVINDSSGNGHNGVLTMGQGSWLTNKTRRIGSNVPEIKQPGSSLRCAGSGYTGKSSIDVTGSNTDPAFQLIKNFTVLAWINPLALDNYSLIGNITGFYGWGIQIAGANKLYFNIGNGTSHEIHTAIQAGMNFYAMGNTFMVGAIVTNDTIGKIKFIMNGNVSAPLAKTTEIALNNCLITVCDKAIASYKYSGDLDDVRIYNRELTELEIRSIYEMRNL